MWNIYYTRFELFIAHYFLLPLPANHIIIIIYNDNVEPYVMPRLDCDYNNKIRKEKGK